MSGVANKNPSAKSEFVQELALECMAYEPQARPTFQQVEERLSKLQNTVQPTSDRAFLRAAAAADAMTA